jgi:hypothetical protein
MSEAEAARDDEDALDVRVKAMTGDELTPRPPKPALAPAPAPFFDDDASIGKLSEDAFPTSAPPPPPKPARKTAPPKPPSAESWDDMSNLG